MSVPARKPELHEKIIVAYSRRADTAGPLLEHVTCMGCCSSKVVLLLDANGRVGQDYRCTESHETTNDWVSVGNDGSEVTSPNGKRLGLDV